MVQLRSLRALAFAPFAALLFTMDAAAQGPILNPANGHYYQAVPMPAGTSWTTSKAMADAMTHMGLPGHLATIADAAENQFVAAMINPAGVWRHWLGGFQDTSSPSYSEPGGAWTWVTGEDWNFTQWNPGEPNDFGGNEHHLAYDNNANWNYAPDTWAFSAGFVVEYEPALTRFCTAKTGLVCGTPSISATGAPSASMTSGFTISAGPARTCRSGILLYNTAQLVSGIPFQGGTLCVDAMGLRRAGPMNSMGTPGSANCDGLFALDVNAFAHGAWVVPDCAGAPSGLPPNMPAAFLTTQGQSVFAQVWGRDSVATGSFLSDGIEYVVGP
jgi:hypothetical protein